MRPQQDNPKQCAVARQGPRYWQMPLRSIVVCARAPHSYQEERRVNSTAQNNSIASDASDCKNESRPIIN